MALGIQIKGRYKDLSHLVSEQGLSISTAISGISLNLEKDLILLQQILAEFRTGIQESDDASSARHDELKVLLSEALATAPDVHPGYAQTTLADELVRYSIALSAFGVDGNRPDTIGSTALSGSPLVSSCLS